MGTAALQARRYNASRDDYQHSEITAGQAAWS